MNTLKQFIHKLPGQALARLSLVLVIGATSFLVGVRGISPAHAASVTDSYSPSTRTVATGQNLSMTVITNAGSSHVLTDQLRVTFNASKLQFVSISYSGTPLDTDAPDAGSGAGYYQISRYTLGTKPTGSFTLATITFKALASTGSDAVGYDAANSSVYLQEDGGAANALTSVSGATYTFDGQVPSVSLTSPTNSSTVSGTVNVAATATDNIGVTKVEFLVDGSVKSTDTTSPYTFSLNTASYSNASHTVAAKAYDAVDNTAISSVSVTVKNGSTSSTSPTTSGTAATTPKTTATPTTPSGTSTTSSTSATPTTSNGVQVATTSPYSVKSQTDKATPKKSNRVYLIIGVSIITIGVAAAIFAALRIVARHREIAKHIAIVPEGVSNYGTHQQPIATSNIPQGSNVITPTAPPQDPPTTLPTPQQ